MKKRYQLYYLSSLLLALLFCNCKSETEAPPHPGGVALAMEEWAMARSYPGGKIYSKNIMEAYQAKKAALATRGGGNFNESWQAIGPKNIGGRTLCLAFHPTDPNTLFVGAASGGLWKSTTQGLGYTAWEYVPTGFPVLGVASIAINPDNAEEMYIGTGEVYNYTAAAPGVANRLTRGTYGIGILKTTDGGATWEKSLDWSLQEMTGVADLQINPDNPSVIYAATTQGLYRSTDAGQNWQQLLSNAMATDIEMHPTDPNTLLVSFGNYLSPTDEKGVYRTQDGGTTWELLDDGLPTNYGGKTQLSYSPSEPNIIYASVADAFNSVGLFKSENGGDNWDLVNSDDVALYQGWYSHDVAVDPTNSDQVIYVGVDGFRSTNGGVDITQVTYWYLWDFGQVPVGGPEGPGNYMHADIHGVYYSPFAANEVFAVTDGGIFFSEDGGLNWEGRNGTYQTQQFYPNFGNSTTDSLFGIGGMQDNSTALYVGDDAWVRVLGGDGMDAAINQDNDHIVFGASQFLNVRRSLDRGESFSGILPQAVFDENRAFNGPFEISPVSSGILYAGAQRLYRSTNTGDDWAPTSALPLDGANPILTIGISPVDESVIYVAMAPISSPPARIFKSEDSGQNWEEIFGLPDRMAMDFAFHPLEKDIVYVVFSGFGSSHVFRTEDGGLTWAALDAELPDVPTNSILVDPQIPNHVYLANDLGVYVSTDEGATWEPFSGDLPDATLAMDLSISPSNRKLRLATHGHGVYQTDLLDEFVDVNEPAELPVAKTISLFPNPASEVITIAAKNLQPGTYSWVILDRIGRVLQQGPKAIQHSGNSLQSEIELNGAIRNGLYYLRLEDGAGKQWVRPFTVL